ncbi:MAG: C39 family peptidase [bacterium]
MILPIKLFSQYSPEIPLEWQPRVCSLSVIKMILDSYSKDQLSFENIFNEVKAIGGYDERYGWNHEALVRVLRNHGVNAYRQEFKSRKINLENKNDQVSEFESEMVNFGLKKNVASLENGFPVIVSVLRHFNEIGTMHSVLVVGFEKDEKGITGLYFNDPDTSIDQENKPVFVNLEVFTRAWRQLAIFIEK